MVSSGAELIAAERARQIEVEGWTAEHDAEQRHGELARAAETYIRHALHGTFIALMTSWPWDMEWWKPCDDPLDDLVKAGALLAAEIDRLLAAAGDR